MFLSLCLATHNEETNLPSCLESAKSLVDEIVIVDGSSTDKTVEIAKKYGAHVIVTDNPPMFHINKQKALDAAKGEWILQLDADERLSPELAIEIKKVINMNQTELSEYQKNLPEIKLFLRHQRLTLDDRNWKLENLPAGRQGPTSIFQPQNPVSSIQHPASDIVAFFIPRLNYFLGKFLRYGGVYPDGAIRLVKKGKAHFPCKDVHEVMGVDGKVGWLQNPLFHYDSPTFKRYLERNNRYIHMMVREMKEKKYPKNIVTLLNCCIVKPFVWFFMTTIRHKGILDGWQGVVFSFFSALRFPRAYMKYLVTSEK